MSPTILRFCLICLLCLAIGSVFWASTRRSRGTRRLEAPKSDPLALNYEMVSLEGTERLTLWFGGRAELRKLLETGNYGPGQHLLGTWRLDEMSGRYRIELGSQAASYALAKPRDSRTCILVAGDLSAADLTTSWFSVFDDRRIDPWDRDWHER
jgi:hypothetical protein